VTLVTAREISCLRRQVVRSSLSEWTFMNFVMGASSRSCQRGIAVHAVLRSQSRRKRFDRALIHSSTLVGSRRRRGQARLNEPDRRSADTHARAGFAAAVAAFFLTLLMAAEVFDSIAGN
jgi:hypothetical protein